MPGPDGRFWPFRCPNAGSGDGADHVVARVLPADLADFPRQGDPNPFVRFREFLHSWHVARAGGLSDADFIALVKGFDRAVAAVDGHGFRSTSFAPHPELTARLGLKSPGAAWVKDETGNVSGSHKARHLMGIALYLDVVAKLRERARSAVDLDGAGPHPAGDGPGPAAVPPDLAIASCGNAALAAAVVARAAERTLRVFVPEDANPRVLERLRSLGARVEICRRIAGVAGDPCVHAFRAATAAGALPFCCQGSDNGLTVEGGETLAWEMAAELDRAGARLDRLFVQVGGGALASACAQGLREAAAAGASFGAPRLHAVQTRGAWPLRRAYEKLRARAMERLGHSPPGGPGHARDAAGADFLRGKAGTPEVREALRHARAHRAEYMWPWEQTPRSAAHGILDDETYDWFAVVEGMIASGGWPVTVSEERLREARDLARSATAAPADHTGTAGLAGLLELRAAGLVREDEVVAVLFTGVER
ncbi:MAG: pyridoxal-phosphate dependent enzyme [Candidatus Eisenbacteria bacterium]|nr:pyridoxal-phosphate dependent enzyme [Candidatus Eisenbacteria bacterium]